MEWVRQKNLRESAKSADQLRLRISSFPIPRLSSEQATDKIDIMKFNRNIGMLLLAIYIIIDSLLGFGLNLGPAIFLLYIVGLAAGVFILIGK